MKCTEVFYSQKQLAKLVAKLQKKNFERVGVCAWSQTWENPSTEETVVLVRG